MTRPTSVGGDMMVINTHMRAIFTSIDDCFVNFRQTSSIFLAEGNNAEILCLLGMPCDVRRRECMTLGEHDGLTVKVAPSQ